MCVASCRYMACTVSVRQQLIVFLQGAIDHQCAHSCLVITQPFFEHLCVVFPDVVQALAHRWSPQKIDMAIV